MSTQYEIGLSNDERIVNHLENLRKLASNFSSKPQQVGFTHKFIFPGWIGLVQKWSIESKMDKFLNEKVYGDKNYIEAAQEIVDETAALVSLHCDSTAQTMNWNPSDSGTSHYQEIITASDSAITCWMEYAPEVATWLNRKVDNNTVTNLLGLVLMDVEAQLELIGRKKSSNARPTSKASSDFKQQGWALLGYIVNIFTLAAIVGLFSAIF